MLNDKLKNYLHLHFLVFIAGFTAILGELISIGSIPLVWYRMLIAGVLMFIFLKLRKAKLNVGLRSIFKFSLAGVVIALHWITFFEAIKQSNISITLAMFSTGAFFASLIEPLFFKRKIIWYEFLFGLLVIGGVWLITQTELRYLNGILLGLASALFAALFNVINGKFVKRFSASVISFYEFVSGVSFISLFIIFFEGGFDTQFFELPNMDWIYLFILGSVCTAYAFIAAIYVMKYISPFTVVLTYNMEPVYGILLAILLFPSKEKMSVQFYIGALIIVSVVIFNGMLKHGNKKEHNK